MAFVSGRFFFRGLNCWLVDLESQDSTKSGGILQLHPEEYGTSVRTRPKRVKWKLDLQSMVKICAYNYKVSIYIQWFVSINMYLDK